MKPIRVVAPTAPTVRDTSAASAPRIDPRELAEALGAEPASVSLKHALGPISLLAVREELVKRLQSNGGRPTLAGATHRAKVSLGDKEWVALEELAEAVSSQGFTPSAGQLASVLLAQAVRLIVPQVMELPEKIASGLVKELAVLASEQPSHSDSGVQAN